MTPVYDAAYFINKFEAIPEEKWTVGFFVNSFGQCCALGHCGMTDYLSSTVESRKLGDIFDQYRYSVANVNDDDSFAEGALGDTPKERIINMLVLIETGLIKETQ